MKLHQYLEGTQHEKDYFVELWDVGGSHSQRNTRHVFMHTVHGVILVHDLANRKSGGQKILFPVDDVFDIKTVSGVRSEPGEVVG